MPHCLPTRASKPSSSVPRAQVRTPRRSGWIWHRWRVWRRFWRVRRSGSAEKRDETALVETVTRGAVELPLAAPRTFRMQRRGLVPHAVEQTLRGQHVRLERWSDLHLEILELGVLRRREQGALDRVNDRLVVRHLVLEVRAIERLATGAVQRLHRLVVIGGKREVLRRRRRDVELLDEIATLLADALVVAHEHGSEVADLFRRALLHGDRTRFDVPGIRGVEDGADRRIVDGGGARNARACGCGRERQRGEGDRTSQI